MTDRATSALAAALTRIRDRFTRMNEGENETVELRAMDVALVVEALANRQSLELRWRPIDKNTPQDGATPILVRGRTALGQECAVLQMVHWERGGSAWCYRVRGSFMPAGWTPTEWMPVPAGEVAL